MIGLSFKTKRVLRQYFTASYASIRWQVTYICTFIKIILAKAYKYKNKMQRESALLRLLDGIKCILTPFKKQSKRSL